MKLILKSKENLQERLENIAGVLCVCLNRGITDNLQVDLEKEEHVQRQFLWMYQNNGSVSNFEKCSRIDLVPALNNYWLYIFSRTDNEIVFEINFRYNSSNRKEIFEKFILELFNECVAEVKEV